MTSLSLPLSLLSSRRSTFLPVFVVARRYLSGPGTGRTFRPHPQLFVHQSYSLHHHEKHSEQPACTDAPSAQTDEIASPRTRSCPVCSSVGTEKCFKSDQGLVGHMNSHIALQVPVPVSFWKVNPCINQCRSCACAFVSKRMRTVCGKCRKKLSVNSVLSPIVFAAL